jgi:hypothetical protein
MKHFINETIGEPVDNIEYRSVKELDQMAVEEKYT